MRQRLGLRLLALFVVLALAVSAVFVAGMQRAFAGGWQSGVRPLLADYVQHLAAEIGSPPDVRRAQALADRLPLRIRIDGPGLHWRSDRRAPEDWDEPGPPPPAARGPGPRPGPHAGLRGGAMRGWLWRVQTPDGYTMRFGFARFPMREEPGVAAAVTLVALLCCTALAYALVRRWLRPLKDIHAGAGRFGSGRFDAPIPVRGRDELAQVAEQVNAMAASIHQMLEAKRALLLAISHELRSPLTRARLNAELAAPPPEAPADSHAAHAGLLADLAQMRDLVTDLLETERLSQGHTALQREPVDVAALAAELVRAEGGGRTVFRMGEGAARLAPVPLDAMRLRMAVRNLLSNALRHQPAAAGPVAVVLSVAAGELRLAVQDAGPGVAPDQLGQLGQAFHRADTARSRSTGGVGLGLYLCRLVAQAHGGRLVLHNRAPGFEAVLHLPLAPPD
jgi:signal transduction histidine kinase